MRRVGKTDTTLRAQAAVKEKKRHPFLVDLFIRLVTTKPLGVVGGTIVLLLFFVGIFVDALAPYGYNDIDMTLRLGAPSREHLLELVLTGFYYHFSRL